MVKKYNEELDGDDCAPFDEFNPRIEYDNYMYNKSDIIVSISNIECRYGNFDLTFTNSWYGPNKNMPEHETTVILNALERDSLKDLFYFLDQFIDEYYCSISDYDDDEIFEMLNNKIRKLVMLYSSGLMMPWIKLESPLLKYDEIKIYNKCSNLQELIDWKNKATRKCMEIA